MRFETAQRLQDGGDVVLHRRFREIEQAADRLVALALHHQRQHIDLPFSQAEVGRRCMRLCNGVTPRGNGSVSPNFGGPRISGGI